MFKYPCPIEKELDKMRDRIWKEAGRNPKILFRMIRESAEKAVKKYQLDSRAARPR